MASQEIVGALIDSTMVTANQELIDHSTAAGCMVEYISRRRAQMAAAGFGLPSLASLAVARTLFLLDGGVRYVLCPGQ